jgi:hypothetical protein
MQMSMNEQQPNRPTITNTTHIGSVSGQVVTGSGNAYGSFSFSGTVSNKEEFLSALRAFKEELDLAHQQGLSEDTYEDAVVEVEAAEREAKKDTSRSDRIVNRLERAKSILTVGTGVATAVTAAVEVSNKLIPLIEAAIQTVGKVFQ